MIDPKSLCAAVSPETLSFLIKLFNLPNEVGNELHKVRAALCGDPAAAGWLERQAAAAPGCGCKGCAVSTMRGAVTACGAAPGSTFGVPAAGPFALGISGGMTGWRTPTRDADRLGTDWMCRNTLGDVSGCELRRLAQDKWPVVRAALQELPNAYSDPTLPNAEIGFAWYAVNSAVIPVSRVLCLHSLVVYDLAGEPIEPVKFGLRGEEVACDGDGDILHVYGDPSWVPRSGWEINKNRCRCLQPPCVCLPAGARSQLVLLLPQLAVGEYGIDAEFEASQHGTAICEPCEPRALCGRPSFPRCVCQPLRLPFPTPQPGGGVAPMLERNAPAVVADAPTSSAPTSSAPPSPAPPSSAPPSSAPPSPAPPSSAPTSSAPPSPWRSGGE